MLANNKLNLLSRWLTKSKSFVIVLRCRLALVLMLVFLPESFLLAGDATTTVYGYIAERERLYAGDVTIRGVEERSTTGGSKDVSNSRDILERMQFDFVRNRLWHEKQISSLISGPRPAPLHEVFACGESASFRKQVESKQITIVNPSAPGRFWDVRACGICSHADMLSFTQLPQHAEALQRGLKEGRFTEDQVEKDGVAVLTLTYARGLNPTDKDAIDGRSRFWIDTKRGFVPIKMESQDLDTRSQSTGRLEWKPVSVRSLATWQLRDEIWVPTSAQVGLFLIQPDDSKFTISHDLIFEWHSVNPELGESAFSLDRLDEPKGTHLIIDTTIDRAKPTIVQHPSVHNLKTLQEIQARNKR